MGKVDQGVVVLWIARHFFKGQLGYIGFGGTGKQVRDLLHIEDLCDLLSLQLENFEVVKGRTFNVGGGRSVSVSLRELTELCQRATKNTIPVKQVSEDRPGDVRVYLTDTSLIEKTLDWRPQRSSEQIVDDVCRWLSENRAALEPVLG
jgi:CDP-paratose 2-epimerase